MPRVLLDWCSEGGAARCRSLIPKATVARTFPGLLADAFGPTEMDSVSVAARAEALLQHATLSELGASTLHLHSAHEKATRLGVTMSRCSRRGSRPRPIRVTALPAA